MAKYLRPNTAATWSKTLRIHGGYGYAKEYEIERLTKKPRCC